ncbi:MAG: hypothetical protein K8H88_10490, partial [Sandaracinaceae bacterium]|nr:hypothetical protein [Sandaracinaceae bacterium]
MGPAEGEMRLAAPGEPIEVAIAVRDAWEMGAIRIGGEPATLDDFGIATAPVEARFGNHAVLVEADGPEGTVREVCSFIAAPRFVSPADLDDTIAIRFTASGVDDDDSEASLESLDDVVLRTARAGMLSRILQLGLPTVGTGLIALPPCVPPPGSSCLEVPLPYAVDALTYAEPEAVDPSATSLTPIEGGFEIVASAMNVRLNVHVEGHSLELAHEPGSPDPFVRFSGDGTIEVATLSVRAELDASVADGEVRLALRR